MIAIQRRHCVPDEADVLVTDTFQRAELAKGFGTLGLVFVMYGLTIRST
jgi:hypothetical protein